MVDGGVAVELVAVESAAVDSAAAGVECPDPAQGAGAAAPVAGGGGRMSATQDQDQDPPPLQTPDPAAGPQPHQGQARVEPAPPGSLQAAPPKCLRAVLLEAPNPLALTIIFLARLEQVWWEGLGRNHLLKIPLV